MNHDDTFFSEAIEGAVLAYFNQGKVCTCPSRFFIQEDTKNQVLAETHTLALRHYQQTKNLLLSYGGDPFGCF